MTNSYLEPTNPEELIIAGSHFGHKSYRLNPRFRKYLVYTNFAYYSDRNNTSSTVVPSQKIIANTNNGGAGDKF